MAPRFLRTLGALLAVASLCVPGASSAERASPGEIVFAADRMPAVSGEIYRVDLDGHRIDLSRSPYKDTEPLISPDGKKVAFFSDRRGYRALFTVGTDGRKPTLLTSRRVPLDSGADVVWSPDSRRLVVATPRALYLTQSGGLERVLSSIHGLTDWSPDGRVITVSSGRPRGHNFVQAITPQGRSLWRVHKEGPFAFWSARGRFGVSVPGGLRVYDERGRLLKGFSGSAFTWSPSGDRLASATQDRLEVRTGDGRSIVLRTRVPGLSVSQYDGIRWVSSSRLVITGGPRGFVAFDIVKKATWPVRYGDVYSADGSLVMHPETSGGGFALQVWKGNGKVKRTIARVPGCLEDGSVVAAVAYVEFTPDNRSLVYQSACGEPFINLYAIRADGTGLRRLTRKREEEINPSVSPDGGRIAYSRADYRELSCKGCPSTIWVRDANGSHPRRLTPAQEDTWDTDPRWSPDGREVLFTRGRLTSESAFVVSADGGRARKVGARSLPEWGPMWSRDGRLAEVERGERAVIDVAGVRRFSLPLAGVQSVAWSPDDRRFVLTASAKPNAPFDVYTVDADGRHLTRLTWNLNASSATWRK